LAYIEIVPYRLEWPSEFASVGVGLRSTLGDLAVAIHHIGSTSVVGLCAKDVIDVQITVASLSPEVESAMIGAGYIMSRYRTDHCPPGESLPDEELAKMLFGVEGRRTNIHVRQAGRFNQAYPLLCRDYLRSHTAAANAYGEVKVQLARRFPDDVDSYYDIKDPVFDVIMCGAREWAVTSAWVQPPSDA